MNEVIHGDCLEELRKFPDNHFDSICTDPPYGLEFMGKEWDGADGFRRSLNEADAGRDSVFGRTSRTSPEYQTGRFAGAVTDRDFKGFVLSQQRTRNVKCPDCGKWAYDHPGRLCECGGIRRAQVNVFQTWCELWAAECLRVLKPGGHMLAFGGTRTYHRLACAIEDAGFEIRDSLHWMYGSGFPKSLDVSKAIDKAAGAEREVVGVRPQFPDGTRGARARPNASPEVYGDRLGLPGEIPVTAPATEAAARWEGWGTALKPAHEPIVVARKPLAGTVAANVLEHGAGALNIDGCRVEGIKDTPASPRRAAQGPAYSDLGNDPGTGTGWDPNIGRWPPNILLSEEAAAELDRQSGSLKSGSNNFINRSSADHLGNTSPAYGAESRPAGQQMISYGDMGGASRFFPQLNWGESDFPFMYCAKAPPKERPKVDGIAHPTCKPLALMRWLVRLVTPPGGICLDPFGGTGTTAEACILEGFRYVLIEREADYIKLIHSRLKKHLEQPSLFDPGEL